jgi:hypothetical protein
MLTIDEVKEYIRTDETELSLITMMNAVKAEFMIKGVKEEVLNDDEKELLKLGMLIAISEYIALRDIYPGQQVDLEKLSKAVQKIAFKLKLKTIMREGII